MQTNVNINGICSISIDNNTIIANGKPIGVTSEYYNALLDEHEEYYEMLVANGLIEKELTEEEILQEMKDKLDKSEQALKKSNEIQEQSNNLILELIERLDKIEKGVSNEISETTATIKNDEQPLSA